MDCLEFTAFVVRCCYHFLLKGGGGEMRWVKNCERVFSSLKCGFHASCANSRSGVLLGADELLRIFIYYCSFGDQLNTEAMGSAKFIKFMRDVQVSWLWVACMHVAESCVGCVDVLSCFRHDLSAFGQQVPARDGLRLDLHPAAASAAAAVGGGDSQRGRASTGRGQWVWAPEVGCAIWVVV